MNASFDPFIKDYMTSLVMHLSSLGVEDPYTSSASSTTSGFNIILHD